MFKSEKGISLVTAVMSVMVMVIILATLVYSAYTNVKVRNLNKLYNDIRTLNDEVAVYYLENNALPIGDSLTYTIVTGSTTDSTSGSSLDLSFVTNDGATFSSADDLINPNDYDYTVTGAVYYYLDLTLFDNITLNYDGDYIINAQSHTIYYVDGVKVGDETYYCIPLDYEDTKYNENHPVVASNESTVYLAYGGTYNLEDAFTFYSDSDKTTKGVPKTLTYEITGSVLSNSYSTYFTLSDGIITSIADEDTYRSFTNNNYYTVKVTATNYDSSYSDYSTTTKIYFTNIQITSDSTSTDNVESCNLLQDTSTATTFYIQKYGVASTLSVTYETTTENGEITYSLSGQKLSITPKVAGYYVVKVSEARGASKTLILNVLNPKIDSTSLTFASLTEDDKTLNVTIDGLEDTGLTSAETWTVYEADSDGNITETTLDNANDIISLSASNLTATVSPVGFGVVYINCVVSVGGEEMKEMKTFSVKVTVTGVSIASTDALYLVTYDSGEDKWIDGNTVASLDEGETAKLVYTVDSNLGTEGDDYEITWSSSNEYVATVDKETGVITAGAGGNTVDITVTVTVGSQTYTDTYTLTVN